MYAQVTAERPQSRRPGQKNTDDQNYRFNQRRRASFNEKQQERNCYKI